MDAYDQRVVEELRGRLQRRQRRRLGSVVPERVRSQSAEYVGRVQEKIEELPQYGTVKAALGNALEGLGSTVATAAAFSVATRLVLARYRRRGHNLARIEDIRELPLRAADEAFPRRKRLVYIGASAAEGGAAGAATLVTEVGTVAGGVAGAGAGGVPGTLATVGVMVADAAATLTASSRLIAETGAYYGYDPADPGERLFIGGVLAAATSTSDAGKLAAQRELRELAKQLARNATWETLNQSYVTKLVQKVYTQLNERLTQRQLGKAVPVMGMVLGAGGNATLMHKVADEAYYAYRERRLRERYGSLEALDDTHDGEAFDVDAKAEGDDVIPIAELAKADANVGAAAKARRGSDEDNARLAFERGSLQAIGFEGWVSFSEFRPGGGAHAPDRPGTYIVWRAAAAGAGFLDESPAGHFKGQDPTVPVRDLEANWVDGAEVVYIGKADTLDARIRAMAAFGDGVRAAHRGGRLVWQLEDAASLKVAWRDLRPDFERAVDDEAALLGEFRAAYGQPPFANQPNRMGR